MHTLLPQTQTLVFAAALLTISASGAAESIPVAGPKPYPEHQQWWGDARFGLFIHWGPVSLKGTEIGWSRGGDRRGYGSKGTQVPAEVYDNLYQEFNPTKFNAREWVAIAQAAGMKYLVFTSRHHDGFSMFDTQANDYKITHPDSPFRRDVVKELADACHEAGLRFGLYYSQPDWHHPDAFTPDRHERYLAYLKQQVTELCSNYGKLDILWFDGLGKPAEAYDGRGLVKIIRDLQPGIVINNRTGLPEDHDTPEQRVGKYQDQRPWETCMTICRQWAWKPDDTMKSLQQCLRTLVACAGGDGNLLFNVGPMPDGRIEPRQVARLKEMGDWLAKYGESIYGTRGGPWKPTKAMASTRRGNRVYLHVFQWDGEEIELPAIPAKVRSATVLTGGQAHIREEGEKLLVNIPAASQREIDTIIRLELDRSAMELPAVGLPSLIDAAASNVYRGMDDYAAECAFDGDSHTRWATDSGTQQAWIVQEFRKPRRIGSVRINEGYAPRVQKFQLHCRSGGEWRTLLTGTQLGEDFKASFSPVTANAIRLEILEATDGPTIWEITVAPE
jgi:alpha-L-fucosidase